MPLPTVPVLDTRFRKEDLPAATYVPNQLYQVFLAELQPDPAQPRKYMDPVALDEMTASVSKMGIIEPVVCRLDGATGLVYVAAGERRCAAARKAGLPTVPAVFIDSANSPEIALVENLLRQDLNPIEEAEALQRLMDLRGCQQDQLAEGIGRCKATISESLSLNKLPQAIRDACRLAPTVPKNVLVEIARKKQERSMLTKYNQYRDKQAKAAAKEQETGAPAARKRTKAEALAEGIGNMVNATGDLEFPDFSEEDRTMLIEAMTALKDTLEPAITRAVKNKKKPM